MPKKFVKKILRSPPFIPLWALVTCLFLKKLGAPVAKSRYLLVLNHIRFKNDLQILNKHSRIGFKIFPSWLQTLINALCMDEKHERADYIKCQKDEVIRDRERLRSFLQAYVLCLNKFSRFDGFLTCSFYYVQDQEWDYGCDLAGIPFIAIYKENLKYEVRKEYAKSAYQEKGFRFGGKKLLVFEHLSKSVLADANIAAGEKIEVVGMPRADSIWQSVSSQTKPSGRVKKVTLFSFRHDIRGMLSTDAKFKGCFSLDRKEGVCELFDQVHGILGEVAIAHPGVEFTIKPKWEGGGWLDHIDRAILQKTGQHREKIPNLSVTSAPSAQDLILQSDLIVGFNSTTLIESILFERPVIIPYFAEASEKYSSDVLFKDYFGIFQAARSPQDFKQMLEGALTRGVSVNKATDEMVQKYVGFFDGKNSKRFEIAIEEAVSR